MEGPELSRDKPRDLFAALPSRLPWTSEPTRELPQGVTFVQTIIPSTNLAQRNLIRYQIYKDGALLMQVVTEHLQ